MWPLGKGMSGCAFHAAQLLDTAESVAGGGRDFRLCTTGRHLGDLSPSPVRGKLLVLYVGLKEL